MAIAIDRLDHLVLTVRDLAATLDFYTRVLGLEARRFGPEGRVALHYGRANINLHEAGRAIDPKAARPIPGSADLCFIVRQPPAAVVAHLNASAWRSSWVRSRAAARRGRFVRSIVAIPTASRSSSRPTQRKA